MEVSHLFNWSRCCIRLLGPHCEWPSLLIQYLLIICLNMLRFINKYIRYSYNFYNVTYNTFYKTFQTPFYAKFNILQSYAKSNFPARWVSFLTYNSTFLVLHNRNILNNALVLSCFLFRLLILIPFASWNTTKSVCPVSDIQLIWFCVIFYPYPHCLL